MSIAQQREHVIPDNYTAKDLLSCAPKNMKVDGNKVTLAGMDLLDIVDKFETALYVYDEDHIRTQLSSFVSHFINIIRNLVLFMLPKHFAQ